MKQFLIVAAALGGLASCTPSNDPTFSAFNTEAGLAYNDGGFGNSTMNNTLVMTGQATQPSACIWTALARYVGTLPIDAKTRRPQPRHDSTFSRSISRLKVRRPNSWPQR